MGEANFYYFTCLKYFRRTDTRGTKRKKSCVKSSQLYKKISNKQRIMSAGNAWLELLLAHHADELRNELDVMVAFVHWCYISDGFVGIGSPPANFELTPARAATLLRDAGGGSELLPTGWNSSEDTWTLAYKLPACSCAPGSSASSNTPSSSSSASPSVILLKAIRIGDDELSVNVIRSSGDALSHSFVPAALINDVAALRLRVKELFVAPFLPETTQPAPDAAASNARNDPRFQLNDDDDESNPYAAGGQPTGVRDPRSDRDPLRDLGRADLDPFSGGGGMIFDPLRAGRGGGGNIGLFGPDGRPLPPGAVPPGARFDPFTPFGQGGVGPGRGRGRGRGFGPDPDHDPPTGWDDMFM